MGSPKYLKSLARIALLGAVGTLSASAALITFDSLDTSGGAVETFTESGATFAAGNKNFTLTLAQGGGLETDSQFAGAGRSLRSIGSMPTMRADLTGFVGYVSVELGDLGDDADLLFLRAYDVNGNEIASSSLQTNAQNAQLNVLEVVIPNIAYVVFGGFVNGSSASSVYADNFIFDEVDPGIGGGEIPEPATVLLFAAGLGAFGLIRRRR